MKQKKHELFESACGLAKVFVDHEMPIGAFHDFIMMLKGIMVERMVAAHKEQEAEAKAAMQEPEIQEPAHE